ncbi:RNA pseudouridine synthase [Phanerochaete sordida]|uniref:RNA pseudouridine synthase n=1 Tax=Phanerochaete sordida TaxID=48140 RepID=A0A9P3G1Q5_9APHY|nr:RNA pseudouridine synthase [Phanerochaete sordida]
MLVRPARLVAFRLPYLRALSSTPRRCLGSETHTSEQTSQASTSRLEPQTTHDDTNLLSSIIENWNPILYEDRGVLVLNKPPGYCVQANTDDPDEAGLVKELTNEYLRSRDLHCEVLPCHRIDKPTTGIVLCSKSIPTARDISQQFQARCVEKTYLALVHAKRDLGEGGTIDARIGRHRGRPYLALEHTFGFRAVTRWQWLARSPIANVQLLKFWPETGRKHQIRVHSAQVLYAPIIGDEVHSHFKPEKVRAKYKLPDPAPGALYLHSAAIELWRYRKTGANKRFRLGLVAPLPQYFVEMCEALQIPIPEEYLRARLRVDGVEVESGVLEDMEGRLVGDYGERVVVSDASESPDSEDREVLEPIPPDSGPDCLERKMDPDYYDILKLLASEVKTKDSESQLETHS